MFSKKSRKADLEKWRSALFFTGLLASTSVVLCAFEWRKPILTELVGADNPYTYLPDEVILTSSPEKPKPTPPPPPKAIDVKDLVAFQQKDDFLDFPAMAGSIHDEPVVSDIPIIVEYYDEPVILIPDVQPEFPGGMGELYNFLKKELKYPAMARDANIQGKVYIQFVVDKDGKISDIEVLRGLSGGLEQEAVRVVKAMPAWTPGKHRGKAVKVRYVLPISFILG